MTVAAPAGWPKDLPPPLTPEFGERVCGWLLDRGPAELRASPVRAMPIALARVVSHTLDAQIQGLRRAYATARVELGEHLTPEDLVQVQHALQAEGARLLQVQRELTMVEAALRAE
jgi:hypothetical protein